MNKISKLSAKGTKSVVDNGTNVAKPIGKPVKRYTIMAVAAICFILAIVTKGAALGAKTALLYIWGDSGKLSGKAGARVFMKNGRSRSYVVPSLVRNINTGRSRGLMSTWSSSFRTLSQTDQRLWNSFQLPISNRFGNSTVKKGKQAYVALNANLSNTGQTNISAPPINLTSPSVLIDSVKADVGTANILVFYQPVTEGVCKIYACAPQGAGIAKPSQSKYRLIGSFDPTSGTNTDITAIYTDRFGFPAEGQKVFVMFGNVSTGGVESARTAGDCVTTNL